MAILIQLFKQQKRPCEHVNKNPFRLEYQTIVNENVIADYGEKLFAKCVVYLMKTSMSLMNSLKREMVVSYSKSNSLLFSLNTH